MTNSRKCNVFSLGAPKFDQKPIYPPAKWLNFANFRGSWSENCIYLLELIIKFEDVDNVVPDNFHFDQNTVWWKLEITIRFEESKINQLIHYFFYKAKFTTFFP